MVLPAIGIGLLIALHLAIALMLILGSLMAAWGVMHRHATFWRNFVVTYLATVGATILSFLLFKSCILTIWEHKLREQYFPEAQYSDGFIAHYLKQIGVTINDDMTFGAVIALMAAGVLGIAFRYWVDTGKK